MDSPMILHHHITNLSLLPEQSERVEEMIIDLLFSH